MLDRLWVSINVATSITVSSPSKFQTIPGTPRPKGLDITAFNSAANSMCRKFEKADTSKKFCKVWKEEVMPLLRDSRKRRIIGRSIRSFSFK